MPDFPWCPLSTACSDNRTLVIEVEGSGAEACEGFSATTLTPSCRVRAVRRCQEPLPHSRLFILVFLRFVFSATASCYLLHLGVEGRVLGLVIVDFLLGICERGGSAITSSSSGTSPLGVCRQQERATLGGCDHSRLPHLMLRSMYRSLVLQNEQLMSGARSRVSAASRARQSDVVFRQRGALGATSSVQFCWSQHPPSTPSVVQTPWILKGSACCDVVLNPHCKGMNLSGSEYWIFLPDRVRLEVSSWLREWLQRVRAQSVKAINLADDVYDASRDNSGSYGVTLECVRHWRGS